MANPNSGDKTTSTSQSTSSNTSSHAGGGTRDTSSMARDTTVRTVRDTANRMTDTISDRLNADEAREMMNRAGEQATEFYDQAQGWMRDNSRMLYMVGGFLAVGIVGYMLGRTFMNRSDIENY